MLQRGCGCVREEDRPLISCCLSLGKGGALQCCPCFLMRALETTETNPLRLDQRYTFLPIVHFTHLQLFVPKGLASVFFTTCVISFSPSFLCRYYILQLSLPGHPQQQASHQEWEGSSSPRVTHSQPHTNTHTPQPSPLNSGPLLVQCATQNIDTQLESGSLSSCSSSVLICGSETTEDK